MPPSFPLRQGTCRVQWEAYRCHTRPDQAAQRMLRELVFDIATSISGQHGWRSHYRTCKRLEAAGPKVVRDRQSQKLNDLLSFAADNVPHYQEALRTPRANDQQDPMAWLTDVPLLDKEVLQQHPERLHGRLEGRTTIKSTGGSTGEPVALLKTAGGVAVERACTWFGLGWFGIAVGDPSVRFWGTPLTPPRRLRFKLADVAMNRIHVSAFALEESDLAEYYERIKRFQPHWFYGYATLIDLLAEWIEATGRDGTVLGLRAIVPTSEPLSEAQRERVTRVFGAPIQNEYGCGEVGAIAYECERGLLHTMTESVVVEVLTGDGRPAGPGEEGEVLVTDLNNYAMPLIRYRLGDQAVRGGDCKCGRPFPTLERVVGRVHDVVFTPAGKRWHGEKMDYLMSAVHQDVFPFRRYQVVQQETDLLEVRLVSEEPVPEAARRLIEEYVRDRLDGMRAHVRRVDRIERSPSGKLRLVKNEVSRPGD